MIPSLDQLEIIRMITITSKKLTFFSKNFFFVQVADKDGNIIDSFYENQVRNAKYMDDNWRNIFEYNFTDGKKITTTSTSDNVANDPEDIIGTLISAKATEFGSQILEKRVDESLVETYVTHNIDRNGFITQTIAQGNPSTFNDIAHSTTPKDTDNNGLVDNLVNYSDTLI